MSLIKRFERNINGRDFAVGDIHGYFTRLQSALDAAGFDPAADRLFSVGDLVDRGPESQDVDNWLAKPWFHAVRGNHEQMAIDSYLNDPDGRAAGNHLANGGAWLYGRSHAEQACYIDLLNSLPLAIEVETEAGLVGIIHADCPFPDWEMLQAWAQGDMPGLRNVEAACQWSRHRITNEEAHGVSGLRALIVGHTPVNSPAILGNVYHIDTAGWLPHMGGRFTLIDLASLECRPPARQKLAQDWSEEP